MLEVHAILHRQRCYENMTEKTGTLSDAYGIVTSEEDSEPLIGVTVQVVGSKGNGVITARCCIC